MAYLRLLLLRTARTNWGISVLALSLVMPAAVVGKFHYDFVHSPAASTYRQMQHDAEMFRTAGTLTLIVSIFAVGNLAAYVVHEERLRNRSRLLRIATVDGLRAVSAFLAFGTALSLALTLAGLLVPGCIGLARGMPPLTWIGGWLYVFWCASAFACGGVWLGYLLPRALALIILQLVSLAGSFALLPTSTMMNGIPRLAIPVALIIGIGSFHLLTLAILPLIWRRTSARVW